MLKEHSTVRVCFHFDPLKNYSMNAQATIKFLRETLRFKISKKIIEEISDELEFLSNSEDLTFSLRFNGIETLSAEDIPEIPEEGSISFLPGNKINNSELIDILIVDDIEFNIVVLRRLLETLYLYCECEGSHKQYSIHSAGSGKQALEFIEHQNRLNGGYRVIFMDCMMPEIDGWQACIEIHRLFVQKTIRILPYIIAYSAFDSREDIIKCNNAGMCAHVSKPCLQIDLCQVLSQWISKSLQIN